MKIKVLLRKKSSWTKGASARTKEGYATSVNDKSAVKWCLFGAAHKCYDVIERETIFKKITAALPARYRYNSMLEYNDASCRTHEQVLAFVRKIDV